MSLGLHESLRDRSVLEVILVPFEDRPSPVHIGYGGAEVVKALIRFPVEEKLIPIIPAESIKGALRAEATRIAKRLTWDGDVAVAVEAHTKKDLHEIGDRPDFAGRAKGFVYQNFTEGQRAEVEDKAVEIYASALCPICRLFGSRYLAGKLLITDAIPEGTPRILTYTSTAINRRAGTVEEGRLYTVEYLEPSPGLAFKFTIIADNVKGDQGARLLALLLEYLLLLGVRLGGSKSRGFGLLKINEGRSYVKHVEFSAEQGRPEQKLVNVRSLLMKEGYYKKMSLYEYIWLLRSSG